MQVRRSFSPGLLAAGLCLAAALSLAGTGCGSTKPRPPKPEVDLYHPSATRRLEAIAATVQTHDTSEVPVLILLLDDPDPAVRMAAGSALETLTGHATGYVPYAPREERAAQVRAWQAWWAGRGTGPTSAPGSVTPPRPPPSPEAPHAVRP